MLKTGDIPHRTFSTHFSHYSHTTPPALNKTSHTLSSHTLTRPATGYHPQNLTGVSHKLDVNEQRMTVKLAVSVFFV